jgi:hypothetical protein
LSHFSTLCNGDTPTEPPWDPFPVRSARPGRRLDTATPTLKAHAAVAEGETEELVGELNVAMQDGDLALIELLARQIGEIANGICRESVEKKVEKGQRAVLAEREVRASWVCDEAQGR